MVAKRRIAEIAEPASVSLHEITPSVAADWIARNTRNRPVRQSIVARYAADMQAGRWRLNGETLVMSNMGTIIDGQHRLLACIKAGVAFRSFVASGVDEESFVTMDSGINRKFSDVVNLLGYPDASRTAAVTRGWWEYQKNGRLGVGGGGRGQAPTVQELQDTLLQNSDVFLAAVKGVSKLRRMFGGGTVPYGVAWIACGLVDEIERDEFFARLEDGQRLEEGDPIFALRRLLGQGLDRNNARLLQPNILLAFLFKAWNKYRAKEDVLVLTVKSSEPMPEPM
jgi:hypothetical protein